MTEVCVRLSGLLALALTTPGTAPLTVGADAAAQGSLDLFELVLGSTAGVVVLSILLLFSAASWAIIAMKAAQF